MSIYDPSFDLGAGDGKYSVLIAKKGAHVLAVDKEASPKDISGVTWKAMPVENWLKTLKPEDKFDAILGKNILQFIKIRLFSFCEMWYNKNQ